MVMKEVLTDLEDMNLLARLFPHYANTHQNQPSQPNDNTDTTTPTREGGEGLRNNQSENQENEQSHSSSSSSSSQHELEIDSSILDKVLLFHYHHHHHHHHYLFTITTSLSYITLIPNFHSHPLDHPRYQTRNCRSFSRRWSSLSYVPFPPTDLPQHPLLLRSSRRNHVSRHPRTIHSICYHNRVWK